MSSLATWALIGVATLIVLLDLWAIISIFRSDKNVNPKPAFDTDRLIGQELNVIVAPEYYQRADAAGNKIGEPELRDRIKGYLKA